MLVLAVKPLREPVFSALGIGDDKNDAQITDASDTDKYLSVVTVTEEATKAPETEVKTVTEAVTAAVTAAETAAETEETEVRYKNDIEKYLYLHFSDAETLSLESRPFDLLRNSLRKIIVVKEPIPKSKTTNGYEVVGITEFLLSIE